MMPRFTLALVPQNAEEEALFFRAANTFKALAEGYLLTPGQVFPHVTLCQFRAQDEVAARGASAPFLKGQFSVFLDGLQLRAAEGGGYWIEYLVRRHPALRLLQERVVEHLSSLGCETFTKTEDNYTPHLTLARSAQDEKNPVICDARALNREIWSRQILCDFACGLVDENGQFLKKLEEPKKKKLFSPLTDAAVVAEAESGEEE